VESLIPAALDNVANADEFIRKLSKYDNEMEEKKLAAGKSGKVVRFVGSVDMLSKELRRDWSGLIKQIPLRISKEVTILSALRSDMGIYLSPYEVPVPVGLNGTCSKFSIIEIYLGLSNIHIFETNLISAYFIMMCKSQSC
jgi:hypothetical protein